MEFSEKIRLGYVDIEEKDENFPLLDLTRENLEEHIKNLFGINPTKEEKNRLLQFFDDHERQLTHWKISQKTASDLLFDIDRILKNHGIEYLYDQENPAFENTTIIYSNADNPYNWTIIYYNGSFYIGDWGSLLEYLERQYEEK